MSGERKESETAVAYVERMKSLASRRMHPFLTGELAIYSIAKNPDLIAKKLARILGHTAKRFQLPGSASFCAAFKHADKCPTFRSVVLILADGAPDRTILSPDGVPYWKAAVVAFRGRYHALFRLERDVDLLPEEFTVISLMAANRGKVSKEELDKITGDLSQLVEIPVNVHEVDNLRQAVEVLSEQVLPRIIPRGETNLDNPQVNVDGEEDEPTMTMPAWEKAGKSATGGMHFREWRKSIRGK